MAPSRIVVHPLSLNAGDAQESPPGRHPIRKALNLLFAVPLSAPSGVPHPAQCAGCQFPTRIAQYRCHRREIPVARTESLPVGSGSSNGVGPTSCTERQCDLIGPQRKGHAVEAFQAIFNTALIVFIITTMLSAGLRTTFDQIALSLRGGPWCCWWFSLPSWCVRSSVGRRRALRTGHPGLHCHGDAMGLPGRSLRSQAGDDRQSRPPDRCGPAGIAGFHREHHLRRQGDWQKATRGLSTRPRKNGTCQGAAAIVRRTGGVFTGLLVLLQRAARTSRPRSAVGSRVESSTS